MCVCVYICIYMYLYMCIHTIINIYSLSTKRSCFLYPLALLLLSLALSSTLYEKINNSAIYIYIICSRQIDR